jgi:hypothetical protein
MSGWLDNLFFLQSYRGLKKLQYWVSAEFCKKNNLIFMHKKLKI